MAYSDNISRLSRLTSILIKLQSSTSISVEELSDHFHVSKRTIYRDLSALDKAGIPIVHEDGRGYALMEGYNIPPVMFTESEANAIIFADKLMAKTKDESLIREFKKAIDKIKSVLRAEEKEKADFLAKRIIIGKNWYEERTSSFLSEVQTALTNFSELEITYLKKGAKKVSVRKVEAFAIYFNTSEHWVLIAWCHLANEFRSFRLDRIQELIKTGRTFPPHKMTLEEYGEIQKKEYEKRLEEEKKSKTP